MIQGGGSPDQPSLATTAVARNACFASVPPHRGRLVGYASLILLGKRSSVIRG
jgi:hypothetical protein